ncbi:hypothetical protein ET445_13870 [Agromyces protaetiae]|uniref:Uncharacterized protein n=1 Tax=Agromyces protaetiae TaxID=2509455 RepID=A0A4P6FDG4_9MICO|nr:hypothetical protein [Agromyces protaetiae]QAY74250.1 hypothetical protein ET445_13870 [Agromyces protaetiae]
MGVELNYSWYVARLREEGSFHTATENLPVDVAEFRRELRRAMKVAGLRLQTSNRSGLFIAWDPDYEVPAEKLRAVMEATSLSAGPLPPSCPNCGGLCLAERKAWRCPNCGMAVLATR